MRVMLKPFGLSSKVVFDDPAGLPTAPLQRFGCCSPHGAFPVITLTLTRTQTLNLALTVGPTLTHNPNPNPISQVMTMSFGMFRFRNDPALRHFRLRNAGQGSLVITR